MYNMSERYSIISRMGKLLFLTALCEVWSLNDELFLISFTNEEHNKIIEIEKYVKY